MTLHAARICAFAAVSIVSLDVAAADRVAIVVPKRDAGGPVERRVRAELGAAGFEVVVVEVVDPTEPSALERAATDTASVAAIAVVRPRGGVSGDVWVVDRVTGKTVLRHVALAPDENGADVFALRAIELLHGSLVELRDEHPPRGDVTPSPALARFAAAPPPSAPPATRPPREAPRYALAAAASLVAAPGGLAPVVAPAAIVSFRASERCYAEATVVVPVWSTLSASDGSALVSQGHLALGARLHAFAPDAPIAPFVAAGLGVHYLSSQGRSSPGFQATTDTIWGAAVLASGGVRAVIAPPLSLLVQSSVLVAFPRPVVAFGDRAAAYTGRPTTTTTLGVEAAW